MKAAGWITSLYGLFILIGGIIGQVKAGSTTSFVMGAFFGVILIMSGVGMVKNKLFPAYLGILSMLVLDAIFTYRFLITMSFMPAGLLCLITLVVLVAVLILIRKDLRLQRKR